MRLLISILLTSSLIGCASTKVAQSASIEQQAQQQAAQLTLSPQEVLAQSAEKLQEALQEELSFYSPRYLSHAQESYAEAQELINKGGQDQQALTFALKSQHYVEAGIANKAAVEDSLALVLAKKDALEEIDSPNLQESGYNKSVDKISKLIQQVEAGKMAEAIEKQTSVISYMVDVEIDTLKTAHLTDAEIMLEKAEDGDADEYAEATFEQAEKTLATSTAFIEQNYAQRDKVEQSGIDALKAAQHAYYVAIESQQLIQIKADAAEQHILSIERLFHRIGKGFEQEDLRYMSLGDQSTVLAQQAEILGKRLANRPTVQEKSLWEKNKQRLLAEIEQLKLDLATQNSLPSDDQLIKPNDTTKTNIETEQTTKIETELETAVDTTEESEIPAPSTTPAAEETRPAASDNTNESEQAPQASTESGDESTAVENIIETSQNELSQSSQPTQDAVSN